jgi:hypothetical protein
MWLKKKLYVEKNPVLKVWRVFRLLYATSFRQINGGTYFENTE